MRGSGSSCRVLDPSGRTLRYAGAETTHGALAEGSGALVETLVAMIAAASA